MTTATRSGPELTATDLDDLARGCALLGTGGGGDVDAELGRVRAAVERAGAVPLVGVDDLDPDGLVLPLSVVGAPRAGGETEVSGREAGLIRDRVERDLGAPVQAVLTTEIGGANGILPMAWAATLGLPLLDADGMGRAFPELPMISMNAAGVPPTPAVVADAHGNVGTLHCTDAEQAEVWVRALTTAAGGSVVVADYLMRGARVPGAVVPGTISLARELGRLVRDAVDPVGALVERLGAARLGRGVLEPPDLHDAGGFLTGRAVVRGEHGDVELDVRNEYVGARVDGVLVAVAPDMLLLADPDTGRAVPTESLAAGREVVVLAWPCHPLWHAPAGSRVAGPQAFGYDPVTAPRLRRA